MSQEVVNSYNIFVDSERGLSSSSNGNNVELPLGQTPITCSANQFIRLTLQSFSMYKSWTNVNENNNKFRISCADVFPAGTGVALSNKLLVIPSKNYASFNDLVSAFGVAIATELTAYTGNTATYNTTTSVPNTNEDFEGTGNMAMSIEIDFLLGSVAFVNPIIIQFFVADGDAFELMGGNRIRDVASVSPSVSTSFNGIPPATSTKINIRGYYNLQLSTQQNIYLRCGTSGSNIQTASYNAKFTDDGSDANLASSNILGKISIQNEFAVFTSATQMEYFINLNVKSLTYLQLYLTDSHDRPIPEYINIVSGSLVSAQDGSTFQDTLGNRSFEACIKVDIVQYLSPMNNTLQSKPVDHTVSPRFGTEPLNKMDYGATNFPTPTFDMLKIQNRPP